MARPEPAAGLVIRYDYLWAREEAEGRVEGAKDRPCAVVVAVQPSAALPLRAIVCAITHAEPPTAADAVEIPRAVKNHLGLDPDRSWVITSEVNVVDWDDPGIVPIASGKWAYGILPRPLAERIRAKLLERVKARKLPTIDRPRIEKRRAAGERAGRDTRD